MPAIARISPLRSVQSTMMCRPAAKTSPPAHRRRLPDPGRQRVCAIHQPPPRPPGTQHPGWHVRGKLTRTRPIGP